MQNKVVKPFQGFGAAGITAYGVAVSCVVKGFQPYTQNKKLPLCNTTNIFKSKKISLPSWGLATML